MTNTELAVKSFDAEIGKTLKLSAMMAVFNRLGTLPHMARVTECRAVILTMMEEIDNG